MLWSCGYNSCEIVGTDLNSCKIMGTWMASSPRADQKVNFETAIREEVSINSKILISSKQSYIQRWIVSKFYLLISPWWGCHPSSHYFTAVKVSSHYFTVVKPQLPNMSLVADSWLGSTGIHYQQYFIHHHLCSNRPITSLDNFSHSSFLQTFLDIFIQSSSNKLPTWHHNCTN